MKAVLAFMGVLAIAGCAMEGKKSGTHQTAAKPAKAKPAPKPTLDDIAFSVAHAGAGPVNPANVYTRISQVNGMIYPLSRYFHYKIQHVREH